MEKISITIPVYNSGNTIARCLDSILTSTYESYEIILINDGSIDHNKEIITEYVKKDNRIRIFSQEYSGISVARNKGLMEATGDIVCFVDSDDYVCNDYVEKLATTFEKEEADVVFFGFQRVTSEGTVLSTYELPILQSGYYENLVSLSQADMFGYTWIKAFRRGIIGQNRFDIDMSLFEDGIFSCAILKNPVKRYFLHEVLYCYVRDEETLANRTYQDYCLICDKVWQLWSNLLKGKVDNKVFLEDKANHMATVCKWYVLERKVNPFLFYREMASSDFMKATTISDSFIAATKAKRWLVVAVVYLSYKIKMVLSMCVHREEQ